MMKNKDKHLKKTPLLLGLIIFFMLITGGIVSAMTCDGTMLGTFKQGTNINLRQVCDSCTYVTLSSVTFPNSTTITIDTNMTKEGVDYNYTFINTSTSGEYYYSVFGDKDGSIATETFCFEINPTGITSSDSKTAVIGRAVWFLFAISLVLFIAFLFVKSKPPIKWTFFLFSIMFFLQAVSILFVGMQDEVVNPKIESYFSFLATSSFILFWFAFGILAVMWIITTFQTILFKKQQRKKEQFGG